MPIAVKVFGLLAEDAYNPGNLGYPIFDKILPQGGWNGFQAVAYILGSGVVVAFRGTQPKSAGGKGDLLADLALGAGANSDYFSAGERFVALVQERRKVVAVCGHSLGGAIAQVVGNRMNLPIVTFNAPGVAVLASRNIAAASNAGTQIRVTGMIASAAVYPGQAIRDMKAAFRPVSGLNIRLEADPVSQVGIHYGEIRTVPQTSFEGLEKGKYIEAGLGPVDRRLAAHGIDTVNKVLKVSAVGAEVI
ncbi:hypothetical protein [Devosia sp. Root635]|uniref:hypothetical protein n=1 Tax=Devosia sp. Root635 TaxID=1736575 RepID=UPI000A3E3EEF|nr:hypothetical protein [Devosia sp. Root635]